jgi:hypothetical protein
MIAWPRAMTIIGTQDCLSVDEVASPRVDIASS